MNKQKAYRSIGDSADWASDLIEELVDLELEENKWISLIQKAFNKTRKPDLMENNELAIRSIKAKVVNTLNLNKIDRNVLAKIDQMGVQRPAFRGHYYSPHELASDIRLIKDSSKRDALVVWLRRQRPKDPIIKQALGIL